jgi:hypothetical protein
MMFAFDVLFLDIGPLKNYFLITKDLSHFAQAPGHGAADEARDPKRIEESSDGFAVTVRKEKADQRFSPFHQCQSH